MDQSFSYDDVGRLKTSTNFEGTTSYTYDVLGNILSRVLGSQTASMVYDTRNRITQLQDPGGEGTVIYGYDSRGNITRRDSDTGGDQRFSYDSSDQPRTATGPVSGSYAYDGHMRRIKTVSNGKTIYNVYDASGQLVFVDEITDQKATAYISGLGIDLGRWRMGPDGAWTFLYTHTDHLGSTQAATDQSGAIAFHEHTGAWGQALFPAAENDNQGAFTGHIRDEATGLTYMQARYYDPAIGRFLSIDPVTFLDNGNPGYVNRYAYAFNNPINNFDPDGRECVTQNTTTCGSSGSSAAANGAVGAASFAAQNTTRSSQVRTQYNNAASQLNPNDTAGRSALKETTRAATPAPQRAFINATRPSTSAPAGTSGNATHTDARTNSTVKALGTVGKASGALAVATGGAQIALSDDKSRTTASVAGSAVGGIAGGIAGAETGALVGGGIGALFGGAGAAPGAVIGAVVGGIGGSIGGGIAGGAAGERIHNELAGQ